MVGLATLWAQGEPVAASEQFPLSWRVDNALVAYVTYLGQLVYPVDLAVLYPRAEAGLPSSTVVGAVFVLGAVTAAAWLVKCKCPYLFVGWFWYLLMLLPVTGSSAFQHPGGR